MALVASETQVRQRQINQQAIHLDLPVSVGAISIIAVIVIVFSSANLAALAFCISLACWCSSSTCSLKLGRSTAVSNACLTWSGVTSIRVSDMSSSRLLSLLTFNRFLVGYFPRGGLLETRFFCAKVGTTSFSFYFGFRLATIEFKNDYKWDNRSSQLSRLDKWSSKPNKTHLSPLLSPPCSCSLSAPGCVSLIWLLGSWGEDL